MSQSFVEPDDSNVEFVLCIGGWFVGNTAVLEFLNTSEDITFLPGDMDVLREYGGIFDHIASIKENIAVSIATKTLTLFTLRKLFNVIKYRLANVTKYLLRPEKQYKFNTMERDYRFLIRLLYACWNYREGMDPVDYWRRWLVFEAHILKGENGTSAIRYILLQNPVYLQNFAPEHTKIWAGLFRNRKTVFVVRDHLDQFVDIRRANQLRHTKDTRFRAGTQDLCDLDRFFHINKKIYIGRFEHLKTEKPGSVFILDFSDFVAGETEGLCSFLGISCAKENFSFTRSARNVGIGLQDSGCSRVYQCHEQEFLELQRLRLKLLDAIDYAARPLST